MTEQLIAQFGGFGVIAIMFIIVLRWLLAHIESMERRQCEKDKRFYETVNQFNITVQNHIKHNTDVLEKLLEALEKMENG